MKIEFNINSAALHAAIKPAASIAAMKTALSVLDCLKLSVGDGTLTIEAADTETRFRRSVHIDNATGSDSFLVNAAKTAEIVGNLGKRDINVCVVNRVMQISSQGLRYKLPVLETTGWPAEPGEKGVRVTVKTSEFVHAINHTSWAASSDPFRPQLQGVNISVDNDRLTFRATDTRVLADYATTIPATSSFDCIVPTKVAKSISSIFPSNGELDISVGEKRISFFDGSTELSTALLNGRFLDFERAIPRETKYTLSVNRTAFASAIKHVAIMSDRVSKLIVCRLYDDKAELEGADMQAQNGIETVECKYVGEPLRIGFNGEQLMRLVSVVDGEQLVLLFQADATRPVKMEETLPLGVLRAVMIPMTINAN